MMTIFECDRSGEDVGGLSDHARDAGVELGSKRQSVLRNRQSSAHFTADAVHSRPIQSPEISLH